jgi:hypothetical protein
MTRADREQPLRFLIHDRDARFSGGRDHVFGGEGGTVTRTAIRARGRTRTPSAGSAARVPGAWTGCSASAAASSSACSASTPACTTGTGRPGHSHYVHRSRQAETRHRSERQPIRSRTGATCSAACSTSTNTQPEARIGFRPDETRALRRSHLLTWCTARAIIRSTGSTSNTRQSVSVRTSAAD